MTKPRHLQRKKKRGSLKRVLLLLISAAVIGLAVYSFQAERMAGNPLPMPFGVGAAVVLSDSMSPALSSGDVVVVRETDAFEVGDVIVYQSGHSLTVHRVVEIDGDTVTAKGDANNAEDKPFPRSAVKGEVAFSVPVLGYAVQAIKTPVGVLIIMAAAVVLLELSFRSDKKERDNEIEKLKAEIRSLKSETDERDNDDTDWR